MSPNLSLIIIVIITSYTPLFKAQIYQVPPITSSQNENIRLDEIYILNQPKLPLDKVYKREIYQQLTNNSLGEFTPCSQSPPEISFSYLGYSPLQRHNKNNNSHDTQKSKQPYPLIYDYEELKSKYTNIVDMVFYDRHVFTISSTGVIRIYRVDERAETGIEERGVIHAVDWKALKQKYRGQSSQYEWIEYNNIGKGYFQFMNGQELLIFANGRFLICMDVRTFKVTLLSQELTKSQQNNHTQSFTDKNLTNTNNNKTPSINNSTTNNISNSRTNNTGISITNNSYTLLEHFQSVTKIDESHFAVLDRHQGAIIYKIQKQQSATDIVQFDYALKTVDIINKSRFNPIYSQNQSMNLIDIKYNAEKDYLLLLDYQKGVFTFNRQNTYLINQTASQPFFVLNPNVLFKKQCNLMELSSKTETLYLVCNKFYKISLEKWPIIEEKVYPHPMISIKEIFIQQQQNIIILAGYQVFKVMYLDRPTAYFEDDMLDKIIFDNDLAVTANQYHIVAYNFFVQKPQILCLTNNQSLIGLHNVVLKTTAECQSSFLQQLNRTKQQKSKLEKDDICIYTVYKNVYVWQQGELPVEGLTIFLIAVVVFLVLMIMWYLATMWRAKRAMAYLINLGGDTSFKLVEQSAPRSQHYKDTKDEINAQNIETQIQINKEKDLSIQIKS